MNFNTDGFVGTIDIGPRDEEDWRQCEVSVSAQRFTAEYECSVRDEELWHLHSLLEAALDKLGQPVTISFQTMEHGFGFDIELGRGGHVDGKYKFSRDWRGPFLSGSFSADQTHLRAWAKELRSALAS